MKECENRGKVYNCNICNHKILISKDRDDYYLKSLFEHIVTCPETNTTCKYCKQESLRRDLKIHMENCEERNIKCEKCFFIYPFKLTLTNPHDEFHCEEIRRLRKNLELFGKKNGI